MQLAYIQNAKSATCSSPVYGPHGSYRLHLPVNAPLYPLLCSMRMHVLQVPAYLHARFTSMGRTACKHCWVQLEMPTRTTHGFRTDRSAASVEPHMSAATAGRISLRLGWTKPATHCLTLDGVIWWSRPVSNPTGSTTWFAAKSTDLGCPQDLPFRPPTQFWTPFVIA